VEGTRQGQKNQPILRWEKWSGKIVSAESQYHLLADSEIRKLRSASTHGAQSRLAAFSPDNFNGALSHDG
jgi:hypothetical protein